MRTRNEQQIRTRPVGPGAKRQPSPEGLGNGSRISFERQRRGTPADEGSAAPPALRNLGSASQPFRTGLTFGSRPYGPGSDLLFISSSHAGSKARPLFPRCAARLTCPGVPWKSCPDTKPKTPVSEAKSHIFSRFSCFKCRNSRPRITSWAPISRPRSTGSGQALRGCYFAG